MDVDIQYKKLKMRKLELEIQKLEKDASRTVVMKHRHLTFWSPFNHVFCFSSPTGSFKLK